MRFAIALLLLPFLQEESVVGPAYPPNAVAGGTVVAHLRVAKGIVQGVAVVRGEEPFNAPVLSALTGWRLAATENGMIPVVVNFRTPNLMPTGSPSRELTPPGSGSQTAFPERVVEPGYPPDSLAEGSVILRLEITEAGGIGKVSILQGLGNITASCIDAVKGWRFSPARNGKGIAVKSSAYAVCVVRRPILPRRGPG
jgi:hypothetical protein